MIHICILIQFILKSELYKVSYCSAGQLHLGKNLQVMIRLPQSIIFSLTSLLNFFDSIMNLSVKNFTQHITKNFGRRNSGELFPHSSSFIIEMLMSCTLVKMDGVLTYLKCSNIRYRSEPYRRIWCHRSA